MKNVDLQTPDQTDSPGHVKEAPPRTTLIIGVGIVVLLCTVLVAAYRPSHAPSPSPVAEKSEPKRLTLARPEPAVPSAVIAGRRPAAAEPASVRPAPAIASQPMRSPAAPYM